MTEYYSNIDKTLFCCKLCSTKGKFDYKHQQTPLILVMFFFLFTRLSYSLFLFFCNIPLVLNSFDLEKNKQEAKNIWRIRVSIPVPLTC